MLNRDSYGDTPPRLYQGSVGAPGLPKSSDSEPGILRTGRNFFVQLVGVPGGTGYQQWCPSIPPKRSIFEPRRESGNKQRETVEFQWHFRRLQQPSCTT
eukprot:1429191-Rhodomonas_salina.3